MNTMARKVKVGIVKEWDTYLVNDAAALVIATLNFIFLYMKITVKRDITPSDINPYPKSLKFSSFFIISGKLGSFYNSYLNKKDI